MIGWSFGLGGWEGLNDRSAVGGKEGPENRRKKGREAGKVSLAAWWELASLVMASKISTSTAYNVATILLTLGCQAVPYTGSISSRDAQYYTSCSRVC